MANLIDRELKLFFTSPLFMALEIAPSLLITVLIYNRLYTNLLPVIWMIIVLYSTFFELELWRSEFLNRGVKLKLYVNTSEYMPFLAHSISSLILLEFKTLIVLMSSTIVATIVASGQFFENLVFFLLATHGNWLFSLSVGYILSKDVFRGLKSSTALFICVLLFSMIAILMLSQASTYWPSASPDLREGAGFSNFNSYVLIFLFIFLLLYVSALFACSAAARNIRIDDI
ncbi:MAG: hypothetical protein QXU11_05510 [Thermoproteota archaeon]